MPTLDELTSELHSTDSSENPERMREIREAITEHHPQSNEAAEAHYKIGLDLLFRARDIARAMERFTASTQAKHPYWSAAARTSLGLCYHHQGKTQKALFELRRVALPDEPTPHSITALTFIETIYRSEGKAQEVERIRKERILQLQKIVETHREQGHESERGFYLHALGLALLDAGEIGLGRESLEDALALGPDALGAEAYQAVVEMLEEIGK